MNEQMEKAFEVVDSIEHMHPLAQSNPVSQADLAMKDTAASNLSEIRLNLSIVNAHPSEMHGDPRDVPVIHVKVKIPSFLWKIPIINGMARTVIKKLSHE